jgi:dihydroorotate dehydrogenase (fumarate)
VKEAGAMDLTTRYLGLTLRNPLVASASPLTADLGNLRRLEDCGAAAVVLPSIFEEQIEAEEAETERLTIFRGESFPEALSYFPAAVKYSTGPQAYLEQLRRAREAIAIPVIASLNGVSRSGWCDYARLVENAGASAIELNAYFVPSDLSLAGTEVENLYLDVVRSVKSVVSIPVAVKLSPYFSAPGRMLMALAEAGADGLVLFNRFYQPDIDLTALRLKRDIELSRPAEIRLPLLWIAVLVGNVRASLAATSGVDSVEEVIKYLLVGADVVMTTTSLLRHGLEHMATLVDGLRDWLAARDISSVAGIRGRMSRGALYDPPAFDRANYIQILQTCTTRVMPL